MDSIESGLQIFVGLVEVTGFKTTLDAIRIDFDVEGNGSRHRGGQRLSATHST